MTNLPFHRPSTPRRWWVPLVACLLVASACALPGTGGSDGAVDDGPDTADDATTGSLGSGTADGGGSDAGPLIVDASFSELDDCPFVPPADTSPRCGTVSVPVDWATGEGAIDLMVAVFPSVVDDPAPDPVVYLEGGPGGHALETARFVGADLIEPLLERGDVIVFDQRGAGLSEPELNCDEITELSRELEDAPGLSDDEVDERFFASLRDCRDRLDGTGVDLAAFNSLNNARDVEAIRVALGYEQWNLLGISYGTRLALEVMRQHPDGVRSVVIDSVFPPQVDSTAENPGTFLASFDAVVEACAAESACAAQGPLDQRLIDVVRRYEDEPVQVEVTDFLAGTTDEVFVEGETLVGVLQQALYSPFWFTDLPELVTDLENGEVDSIEAFLSQQRTNEPFFTDGMFYAIECNEEIAFADPDIVRAALPPDPFGLQDGYDYASNNGLNAFGTCEAFGSAEPPPAANEAVVSDLPTLVMAGRFDPVTPVSWAERAAETLSNSHLVVAPHDSHGVSPGPCGMSIVRAFLDDPGGEPDGSCYEDETFSFLGAPPPTELEPFSYESQGGILSGLRPSGWEQGDLDGDFYRQESLLDGTLLFQLIGVPGLEPLIENYVTTTVGIELNDGVRVPGPAGRSWNNRRGQGGGVAAELYQTTDNGFDLYVLLVTGEAELQDQIDNVLVPVLESLEVEPL